MLPLTVEQQPETVYTVLQKAKPRWNCEDLRKVHAKLHKVNITSVESLGKAVSEGCVNSLLAAVGERKFKPSTLHQLSYVIRPILKQRSAVELAHAAAAQEQLIVSTPSSPTFRKPPRFMAAKEQLEVLQAASKGLGCRGTRARHIPDPGMGSFLPEGGALQYRFEELRRCDGRLGASTAQAEKGAAPSSSSRSSPSLLRQAGGRIVSNSSLGTSASTPSLGVGGPVCGGNPTLRPSSAAIAGHSAPRFGGTRGGTRGDSASSVSTGCPSHGSAAQARAGSVPLPEGGMRHDDDALEELLRKADGVIRRGRVQAQHASPRSRETAHGSVVGYSGAHGATTSLPSVHAELTSLLRQEGPRSMQGTRSASAAQIQRAPRVAEEVAGIAPVLREAERSSSAARRLRFRLATEEDEEAEAQRVAEVAAAGFKKVFEPAGINVHSTVGSLPEAPSSTRTPCSSCVEGGGGDASSLASLDCDAIASDAPRRTLDARRPRPVITRLNLDSGRNDGGASLKPPGSHGRLEGRVTLTSPKGLRIGLSVARGGLDLDLGDDLDANGDLESEASQCNEDWACQEDRVVGDEMSSLAASEDSSARGFFVQYDEFRRTYCTDEAGTERGDEEFAVDEEVSTRACSSEADDVSARTPASLASGVTEALSRDCNSKSGGSHSGGTRPPSTVDDGNARCQSSAASRNAEPSAYLYDEDDCRAAGIDEAAMASARRPVLRRIRTPRGTPIFVPAQQMHCERPSGQASGREKGPNAEAAAYARRMRLVRVYNSGVPNNIPQLAGGHGRRIPAELAF